MDERSMMLVTDWRYRDLTGWLWSEKYDGCRAYWDGSELWTRHGNIIPCPSAFKKSLPSGFHLDGEIWAGHGNFEVSRIAVQFGKWNPNIRYMVFDAPESQGAWAQRMTTANRIIGSSARNVQCAAFGKVEHREHPSDLAKEIIDAGGEGAVFRDPFALYTRKRTIKIQRIKQQNLYAPWRKENWSRSQARWNRADAFSSPAESEGQDYRTRQILQDIGPMAGIDVRRFPLDPEIDWNIRNILSDGSDLRSLTRI